MKSEFAKIAVRFPVRFVATALLGAVLLGAGAVIGAQGNRIEEEAETVKVVESTVTVTARVECKKYEKKVLHCTVDPSDPVARNLDMRLLLGYTAVEVDGNVYDAYPIPGSEVKFIPQGEESRVDVSGTREIRLSVVYVE